MSRWLRISLILHLSVYEPAALREKQRAIASHDEVDGGFGLECERGVDSRFAAVRRVLLGSHRRLVPVRPRSILWCAPPHGTMLFIPPEPTPRPCGYHALVPSGPEQCFRWRVIP